MKNVSEIKKERAIRIGENYKIKELFSVTSKEHNIKVVYTLIYRQENIRGRYYHSLYLLRGIIKLQSPDCITYDKEKKIVRKRAD